MSQKPTSILLDALPKRKGFKVMLRKESVLNGKSFCEYWKSSQKKAFYKKSEKKKSGLVAAKKDGIVGIRVTK